MKNLNVSVFAVFSGIVVFSGIGIVNKWTGFYRIGTSVMTKLIAFKYSWSIRKYRIDMLVCQSLLTLSLNCQTYFKNLAVLAMQDF